MVPELVSGFDLHASLNRNRRQEQDMGVGATHEELMGWLFDAVQDVANRPVPVTGLWAHWTSRTGEQCCMPVVGWRPETQDYLAHALVMDQEGIVKKLEDAAAGQTTTIRAARH